MVSVDARLFNPLSLALSGGRAGQTTLTFERPASALSHWCALVRFSYEGCLRSWHSVGPWSQTHRVPTRHTRWVCLVQCGDGRPCRGRDHALGGRGGHYG